MRAVVLGFLLSLGALLPTAAGAQVYQLPTSPPEITAASEAWQLTGDPIFFEGAFYYPTGPTVFFNGFVMVRSGMFRGVPVYTDTTLAPYSVVYVPVGRTVMRPYERKREGALAGTAGSRMPSFPIERDVEVSSSGGTTPRRGSLEPPAVSEAARPVGTSGVSGPGAARLDRTLPRTGNGTAIESIRKPVGTSGVWIEFARARWYRSGAAVPYLPERFVTAGSYRGFAVYREVHGRPDRIYVSAVQDGALVPYERHSR